MKKGNFIVAIVFFILGISVFYFLGNSSINNYNPNYIYILIFSLIFLNPLIKYIFPVTKKMGIGTPAFFPNLFKSIFAKK
ncbi:MULTISPECIES: hypothetical protein [Chryseobacterium]|uniref:Divalent metal cation (Fe/Co/Zn/Cd) transporter n=1 Tax=Chryseobacterium camelliae TaxID=1265445 RepID=A0ABU0TI33_9FLAO|nr:MULTISPECIES: hypothetical protein [Chryseobacterium]MDT3409415.1 divalent metal cation (Fe/Co/Zn/Cd) transporter [Pseudacidovorax intermedius]MDQ1096720.1 divalent metal cation (Fe/Co/Zn/Cd) transporter [Chryseobacterium camelliae]MDQ1100664.1 divalent metal cation (Fe/Co/Zn/Cd) transporter [Chryseobacterium sp. SORGH_AS_1048]MDR6088002.1 divalent metal cation (Fe/Co/Zn/Cd) transporter [Chryseobacterium sp. SORGH_AS_0909]MDR6132377.1 divalent metal cation (Fe/Co/Zn/Cd) transporter [Chryseo